MNVVVVNGSAVPIVVLEQRLEQIVRIQRGAYFVREDLSTRQLSGITWFFWSFLGVFCPCVRARVYHSNLSHVRAALIDLESNQTVMANANLLAACQRARQQFEVLYPVRIPITYSSINAFSSRQPVFVPPVSRPISVVTYPSPARVAVAVPRPVPIVVLPHAVVNNARVSPGQGHIRVSSNIAMPRNHAAALTGHVIPGQR